MTRLRNAAVGLVIAVLVVVGIVRLVSSERPTREVATPGFEGLVVPSTGVVRWSPDGSKVALLVDGALVVVAVKDGRELARVGRTVVDSAWMPDATRVLAVEGPIPTGQIAAIRTNGETAGTTTLRPSIAFGTGLGLATDARGTRAVAVTTTRDAIGGATHSDLAIVELQTGQTRVLATPDRDEFNPVFVDDTTVAYASQGAGRELRLHFLDLESERRTNVGVIHDGPFGVLATGETVVGHRASQGRYRLDAIDAAGERRTLGVVDRQRKPVGIDRFGTRVLVRIPGADTGAQLRIDVLSK